MGGEERHPVEDLVDGLDDVFTVDHEGRAPGHPQGDVEHRALFGGVDPFPPPHGLDPAGEIGPGGEGGQQADRLGREPVLRVVEEEVAGLDRHRLAPLRVVAEEGPEVDAAHGGVVVGQPLPFGAGRDGLGFAHRVPSRSSADRRCPVSLKLRRTGDVRPRPTRVIEARPRNIRQATVPSTPRAQAVAALIGET